MDLTFGMELVSSVSYIKIISKKAVLISTLSSLTRPYLLHFLSSSSCQHFYSKNTGLNVHTRHTVSDYLAHKNPNIHFQSYILAI